MDGVFFMTSFPIGFSSDTLFQCRRKLSEINNGIFKLLPKLDAESSLGPNPDVSAKAVDLAKQLMVFKNEIDNIKEFANQCPRDEVNYEFEAHIIASESILKSASNAFMNTYHEDYFSVASKVHSSGSRILCDSSRSTSSSSSSSSSLVYDDPVDSHFRLDRGSEFNWTSERSFSKQNAPSSPQRHDQSDSPFSFNLTDFASDFGDDDEQLQQALLLSISGQEPSSSVDSSTSLSYIEPPYREETSSPPVDFPQVLHEAWDFSGSFTGIGDNSQSVELGDDEDERLLLQAFALSLSSVGTRSSTSSSSGPEGSRETDALDLIKSSMIPRLSQWINQGFDFYNTEKAQIAIALFEKLKMFEGTRTEREVLSRFAMALRETLHMPETMLTEARVKEMFYDYRAFLSKLPVDGTFTPMQNANSMALCRLQALQSVSSAMDRR